MFFLCLPFLEKLIKTSVMGDAEFCDFVTKNLNVIFRQFSAMVAKKNVILLHFFYKLNHKDGKRYMY